MITSHNGPGKLLAMGAPGSVTARALCMAKMNEETEYPDMSFDFDISLCLRKLDEPAAKHRRMARPWWLRRQLPMRCITGVTLPANTQ